MDTTLNNTTLNNATTNNEINGVIYARVSSKNQEKEGFSIPAQLDLLRDYAQKHNINVVREFVESESAKKAGRTQFNEMLKFLKKNKDVVNILVEKTDRLYRNFKDYVVIDESIYTVHLVKEHKIISKDSPSSAKLEHGFKVLIAKNYIDNLSEETKKGRREKFEEGYFIGQVPYGYIKKDDKRTTIPDVTKSLFVKRAFELYGKGNISLRALRIKLYKEGYIYLPSSPKISVAQLEHMLKNKCYVGYVKYCNEYKIGHHKPLVSQTLFKRVQDAFKKDNKPDKIQKHMYLYKGLIRCSKCGKTITCETAKKKHIYYHCTGNNGKCKMVYTPESVLDKQFNEAIKRITIDETLSDYLNTLLDENYAEMKIATKEKAAYLQREIKKIETNQEKLLDLLVESKISQDMFDKKNSSYEKEIKDLREQIKMSRLDDKSFIDEGKKIIEQGKQLYSLYLKQNTHEKRKMLKNIFSNLFLDGQNLHYEHNRPFCYFDEISKNKKKLLEKFCDATFINSLYSSIINTSMDFFYKLQGFSECI